MNTDVNGVREGEPGYIPQALVEAPAAAPVVVSPELLEQLAGVLAAQMKRVTDAQDKRIVEMTQAFGRYRDETKQKLIEIVDGKQLVLDPVLSQRLQTMAERLQAPTYSIQIRGKNGLLRPANLLAVGSFAGTVQLTVDEGVSSARGTNIFPAEDEPDYRG